MKATTRLALMAAVSGIALLVPLTADAATTTWKVMPFAAGSESAQLGSLVVDISAAVAVILGEPGCGEFAAHLEDAIAR